jgi:hypothetical protein
MKKRSYRPGKIGAIRNSESLWPSIACTIYRGRKSMTGWVRRAVCAVTHRPHTRGTSGAYLLRGLPEGGLRDEATNPPCQAMRPAAGAARR